MRCGNPLVMSCSLALLDSPRFHRMRKRKSTEHLWQMPVDPTPHDATPARGFAIAGGSDVFDREKHFTQEQVS